MGALGAEGYCRTEVRPTERYYRAQRIDRESNAGVWWFVWSELDTH